MEEHSGYYLRLTVENVTAWVFKSLTAGPELPTLRDEGFIIPRFPLTMLHSDILEICSTDSSCTTSIMVRYRHGNVKYNYLNVYGSNSDIKKFPGYIGVTGNLYWFKSESVKKESNSAPSANIVLKPNTTRVN